MNDRAFPAARAMDRAVAAYRELGNFPAFLAAMEELRDSSSIDDLISAVEPYIDSPEIAGPVYEHVVDQRPNDARALVVLAGAYWLTGRGPDVVGGLASRALAADPSSRGAWHLWALSESDPRVRMERWMQVSKRFANDDLARANLADNASSLAGAESDPVALAIAIENYELLLASARNSEQRDAIERALATLRGWRI